MNDDEVVLKIWKYEIPITDSFELEIPNNFKILDFKVQSGFPVIWVSVFPEQPICKVKFRIFGTGHQLPYPATHLAYVGTVLMNEDRIAWHLFRSNEANNERH